MTLKHVLKHFNKTEVQEDEKLVIQRTKSEEFQNQDVLRFAQDDERFSLAPMRKREELLCERSELSNSGEGYISCAERTVTVFSPFTSHFSQLCTPHPSPLPQGAREQLSCAKHTEKNLFSYSPIHLFTFKKVAFTLAEVLITLGIIGVVAAMTLPTLIQNHQKQTYVNGLKKAMSTFSNLIKDVQAEEGGVDCINTSIFSNMCDFYDRTAQCEDSYGNTTEIDKTISKHLKVLKKEKSKGRKPYIGKGACNVTTNNLQCDDHTYGYILHGGNEQILTYYTVDGMIYDVIAYYSSPIDSNAGHVDPKYSGAYLFVYVDVNGNKGPNEYGRDIFLIIYNASGKIVSCADGYMCNNLSNTYKLPSVYLMENGWKMDY